MNEEIKKKPVLLHFHIFKNAGRTIQWILVKNFSNNAIRIDFDKKGSIMSQDFILNYLTNHPKIKFFSSHQIRFPVPESSIFHFLPILFLRHPIDRIYSIYNFHRKRPNKNRLIIQKAHSLNFNDFVEWVLENTKSITNFQTRYVSNQSNDELNKNDLKIASGYLKNCTVIGTVDRFNESLVASLPVLSQWFKNLDIKYVRQNVTTTGNENFEKKLDEIKSKLKDDVINELFKKNDFDFQLYSLANKEIDNRIESIKDFEIKLLEFQKSLTKKHLSSFKVFISRNKHVWNSHESN